MVRAVLTRSIDGAHDMEVAGIARDGLEAVAQVQALHPDVVTLDVEMPRLDGLGALERIMRESPARMVMVSSLTREGADATIQALELGAIDFIQKAVFNGIQAPDRLGDELLDKIRHAAVARLRRRRAHSMATAPAATRPAKPSLRAMRAARAPAGPEDRTSISRAGWRRTVVVIGSSTGGPQSLREVTTALPEDFGAPIVIVQHMPPGFTRSLAQRLNDLGPLPAKEASEGDRLRAGHVLLAPGGYHLTFDDSGVAHLDENAEEHGVRPAVNVTMASVVEGYRSHVLGVVLTGMGIDGTRGARLIKEAGGQVIAQDEASSVVYGMPRSVAEQGLVDEVLPLERIADAISARCRRVSPATRSA